MVSVGSRRARVLSACGPLGEGCFMAGVSFAHRKRKIGEMSGVVAGIEHHPIELGNRAVAILLDADNELGLDLVDTAAQGSWCKGCLEDSKGFHAARVDPLPDAV